MCPTAHERGRKYLVAVRWLDQENVSGRVGQLDAVRRHRLNDSIWAYEGRSDEVKSGIQVLLCRQIMLRSSGAKSQQNALEDKLLPRNSIHKHSNRNTGLLQTEESSE